MKTQTTTSKQLNLTKLLSIAFAATAVVAIFSVAWTASQQANAAIKNVQTDLDMTTATAPAPGTLPPSEGFTATATSLTQKIDNENFATAGQKEAVSIDTHDSSSVSVDLTVEADWENKLVDARFYGTPSSESNPTSVAWPLISFATFDDGTSAGGDNSYTGFRVYDTNGDSTQKWYNLPEVDFTWGETYNLRIAYNATTDNYDFYIDGDLVKSLYASHSGGEARSIFRNAYYAAVNSGTADAADNYSVTWSNAKYGQLVESPDVATFPNAGDDKKVTLATPTGTAITDTSAVEVSDKAVDSGYEYPLGLVDFSYTTVNDSDEITLVFVTDLKPEDVIARKYNPADKSYTNIDEATITETTQDGKHALQLTYTIADNGPLDLNPTKGEVTDPVGLAVSTIGVPDTGLASQNLLPIAVVGLFAVTAVGSSVMVSIKRRSASKR